MPENAVAAATLAETLSYQPVELRFGTSGRRGLVEHLTQLEIYINVRGELDYLLALPAEEGGLRAGEPFYLAHDLRPSSTATDTAYGGRGAILQAALRAVADSGLRPVNLGPLPTPALTAYALERGAGSLMVTGSHIPFDRNGYKMNSAAGELMKHQEAPINAAVARRREALYNQPAADSLFGADGMLRAGGSPIAVDPSGEADYIDRYVSAFGGSALQGFDLLFYQHSSVGRDLGPRLLAALGARVTPVAPSSTFVPIDTENLEAEQLAIMQAEVDRARSAGQRVDAVVSMDGDADRPLFLWVAPDSGKVNFLSGDLLGMLTADLLQADAVVVPVSCNDAIDRLPLASALRPRTRIGSPFVIAGMTDALADGRQRVCGWEANGGFLLGSDFDFDGKPLRRLPTRDAVLPLIAALMLASRRGVTLEALVGSLPRRFGATALLKNYPRTEGLELVARLGAPDAVSALNSAVAPAILHDVRTVNRTDGVRVTASNGDVVHLRPSGNADEFRIYALADTKVRAEEIAATAAAAVRAGL